MIIVFALGIHFLLITTYAYLIMSNHSRLRYIHLLLALFVPFAGELCLLAAEIGIISANPVYTTKLKKGKQHTKVSSNWICPQNWKEIILGDEKTARDFLMEAIDSEDALLPEILKAGLFSLSSEISHIAASRLMKMHRTYEDAIVLARDKSKKMPHNMRLLASYIDAVDAYRVSGLLDEVSYSTLKNEELSLLEQYMSIMPDDQHYKQKCRILSGTEADA